MSPPPNHVNDDMHPLQTSQSHVPTATMLRIIDDIKNIRARQMSGESVSVDTKFAVMFDALSEMLQASIYSASRSELDIVRQEQLALRTRMSADRERLVVVEQKLQSRETAEETANKLREKFEEEAKQAAEDRMSLYKTIAICFVAALLGVIGILTWFYSNYGLPKENPINAVPHP